VISQVAAGRKNAISFEIGGSQGSVAWRGEQPEELWLGHRDEPNATLLRNPALMAASSAATTHLPAGHAEGFADTFRELYRAVYRAVAAGAPGDDYPTFRAGHVENVLGEAIALSNRDQRWVEVNL
jgi:predicted dehydrogenase